MTRTLLLSSSEPTGEKPETYLPHLRCRGWASRAISRRSLDPRRDKITDTRNLARWAIVDGQPNPFLEKAGSSGLADSNPDDPMEADDPAEVHWRSPTPVSEGPVAGKYTRLDTPRHGASSARSRATALPPLPARADAPARHLSTRRPRQRCSNAPRASAAESFLHKKPLIQEKTRQQALSSNVRSLERRPPLQRSQAAISVAAARARRAEPSRRRQYPREHTPAIG